MVVLPSRWKPWVYILVISSLFFAIFLAYLLEPPKVERGDTVKIKYSIYYSSGVLFEQSPTEGHEYVLLEGTIREPTALFGSVYHRHAGDSYVIEVIACPGHNCSDFGGYTHGDIAWQYQKFDITILEIIKS